MSIGFHLELGYQSGYLGQLDRVQQWEFLADLARAITGTHGAEIRQHALDYGFPANIEGEVYDVNTFATVYLRDGGLLIKGEEESIAIYASGDGDYRTAKEAVALAVCHVIMIECAKKGFHVNLMTV